MERSVEDRQLRRGTTPMLSNPVQPSIAEAVAPINGRKRREPTDPHFADVAKAFINEFEVITQGQRNAGYVESKPIHIRVHLAPFFGDTPLADITAGKVEASKNRTFCGMI